MTTNHETHVLAAAILGVFAELPTIWKAGLVIVGCLTAGWAAHAAFAGVVGLEPRVERLESGHKILQERIGTAEAADAIANAKLDLLDQKIERLICFDEASRGEHGYERCAR